jgi:hypothetical protein
MRRAGPLTGGLDLTGFAAEPPRRDGHPSTPVERILGAMTGTLPRRRRVPLTGLAAVTGVVLGHGLAYIVTVPGAGAREALLLHTGHNYWSIAMAMAVVFGAVSVIGTVVRHARIGAAKVAHSTTAWERYRSSAIRLVALQSAVFVVQEILERVHAGVAVSGLVHGGFLLVGLAVQILVAAALAVILSWLGRAAEAIGRALAPAPALLVRRARLAWPASAIPVRVAPHGPRNTRAPPFVPAASA